MVPLCILLSVTTAQAENYPDLENEFSLMVTLSEHDLKRPSLNYRPDRIDGSMNCCLCRLSLLNH